MRETTERGFTIYDRFSDTYGAEIRVQESSSAEQWCVWIFTKGGGTVGDWPMDAALHLSIEQARRLRDALDAFLADAAPQEGGA